jgi:hypothetical protein
MKLDTTLTARDYQRSPRTASPPRRSARRHLVDGSRQHGFCPFALAAERSRVKLGAVAIAFPRSPMSMAPVTQDLPRSRRAASFSASAPGSGHIERRYGFKWEPPVPQLRSTFRPATIFKCWQEGGKKFSFTGEYYNFSLLTPFFAPKPHHYDIGYVAGVNEMILRMAGGAAAASTPIRLPRPEYLREFPCRMSRAQEIRPRPQGLRLRRRRSCRRRNAAKSRAQDGVRQIFSYSTRRTIGRAETPDGRRWCKSGAAARLRDMPNDH